MKKIFIILVNVFLVFPYWIIVDPFVLMYQWRTKNYLLCLKFNLNCVFHRITGRYDVYPF